MTDNGKFLAGVVGSNYVYATSDSGANWLKRSSGVAEKEGQWTAVTLSNDGSLLVAAVNGGSVYTYAVSTP